MGKRVEKKGNKEIVLRSNYVCVRRNVFSLTVCSLAQIALAVFRVCALRDRGLAIEWSYYGVKDL